MKGLATTGIGVEGSSTGTNGIGVEGVCSGSNCQAGYFSGAVSVAGSFSVGGVCEFDCTSDERLKRNVEPMKDAAEKLLQLHGVTYEWKDSTGSGHSEGKQRGFIAQDVEKVFPNWVSEDRDGFKTLTIDSRASLGMIVEAFRSLWAENNDLKARVKALEDARRPIASFNPNWGVFAAGLVIGGAVLVSGRRRRDEKQS